VILIARAVRRITGDKTNNPITSAAEIDKPFYDKLPLDL
jgi:hypothetical protein